jgi:hypothetical protein
VNTAETAGSDKALDVFRIAAARNNRPPSLSSRMNKSAVTQREPDMCDRSRRLRLGIKKQEISALDMWVDKALVQLDVAEAAILVLLRCIT